jgi:hypothetical protein
MKGAKPDQHENLRQNTEPDLLLEAVQKLEAKCEEYVEWLRKPWEEATAELIREDRVRTTPRASATIQAEA